MNPRSPKQAMGWNKAVIVTELIDLYPYPYIILYSAREVELAPLTTAVEMHAACMHTPVVTVFQTSSLFDE